MLKKVVTEQIIKQKHSHNNYDSVDNIKHRYR